MSIAVREILRANRPPGPPGRGDKYLPDLAQDLRTLLDKTQRGFPDRSLAWPPDELSDLAAVLVEFGEDLHADCGLWRSLENYHREFFGTPLPLAADLSPGEVLTGFDPRRIQHLIWTLWQELAPPLCPRPSHPHLLTFATVAASFLTERFARLPKDSSVKNFLAGPSRFGWEIKTKLIWLGTKSYLFRWLYTIQLPDGAKDPAIGIIDHFICEEATAWAGLGAIDILAGALAGAAEDRAALRSWYERHTTFYRVLSRQDRGAETEFLFVRNLVNGQPYTVRMNLPACPFQPGWVVYGSLTPWRGEWYWSGEQRPYLNVPEHEEAGLRRELLQRHPALAYRYCPAEAAQARTANTRQRANFLAYYDNDLVVYPDGLALATAEQKRMEALWQAAKPETIRQIMQERGLEKPRPGMRFPREFLDHDQGIGAFYDPAAGVAFMTRFNHVVSGLRKQGDGLTSLETDALRHFVTDSSISPAFVQRLVRDHGATSLLETFHLRDLPPEPALAFLLRSQKGHYYRNHYPSVGLVEDGKN